MQVKAIKACHYYQGREPGEVFEAEDRFAHLLIRLGSVEAVTDSKDMQAEETATDKPARAAYKRKDMQAEGSAK